MSSADHCFVHGVDEPAGADDFRVCGECGHVWRTRADFRLDVALLCRELHWPMPPHGDIPFCPLCSHDW